MIKRRTTRFSKNIPVELTIAGNSGEEFQNKIKGWIVDLSNNGLKIFSESVISDASSINIHLPACFTDKAMDIKSNVVWSDLESGMYGVHFNGVDKKQRDELNRFLEKNILGLNSIKTSLKSKIALYKKRAREMEEYLEKHPDEWGKFQNEFNAEINGIFEEIMDFEKENMLKGNVEKIQKLKQIFVDKFRSVFARGQYVSWSLRKPFGYSGDFKIMDDLYRNNPTSLGFERLFDNYTQMSAIAIAVRNRKEDFKRFISNEIKNKKGCNIRIMNLASGPCRLVQELLDNEYVPNESVVFDCYELEQRGIDYARKILGNPGNVNFFRENAIKLALKKNIYTMINEKYDIIYSMGLFDYFNEEIATRLVGNLKKLLKKNGKLIVATVRDKYSNPSVYFMEWAADWNLIYRSDKEFVRIFNNGGFNKNQLSFQYEQQGIIGYLIAAN